MEDGGDLNVRRRQGRLLRKGRKRKEEGKEGR